MEAKYKVGAELATTDGNYWNRDWCFALIETYLKCHRNLAHGLLKDEKWLASVMDEQQKLFEKKKDTSLHPSMLTYEDAQGMPIFDQVLSETLRMHPPFFQLSRSVKVDCKFQGNTTPKGHIVNISPGAAQRLSTLWDKPNAFDPSRFTTENKKEIKPYAWIRNEPVKPLCRDVSNKDNVIVGTSSFLGTKFVSLCCLVLSTGLTIVSFERDFKS
jgi:hypothetical protein